MFTPIVAPEVLEQSEARSGKTTICHRTKSVKNPYRKITVSTSALNSGHKNHDGGLWTTSSVQGDTWGDIIPDATAGGSNTTAKNFTPTGEAIWRGLTLNPATGSAVCKTMTMKQFKDSELEAGQTTAQIIASIKDAEADEDEALLRTLGLTFNTFDTTSELDSVATASQAVVVTTQTASSVTTTTATLNGSVKTDATVLTCHFEYSSNSGFDPSTLNPSTATSVPINATTSRTVNLTGLTTSTKYYYRLVCHDSGGGDIYGDTFFFTTETTYSIVYDSNTATSGDVPSDSSLYAASESAVVLGNAGVLVKTGSTFVGWTLNSDGTGTVYSPSNTTTIAMSENRVLYAKWTVETYTVAFNGNTNTGGAVPSSQTKTYNVSLTLSGNTGSLAKTGHSFADWNTASGGGGTSYAAGAPYTTNAAATLYAQWTPDTYTVTYNGNGNLGGAVPADQTKTYSVSLTLRTNSGTLTKGTGTFSCWNTSADGTGTNYAEGASYTVNAGTTLYAKWTSASDWSVNYLGNGNDGGSAPASQTVTRGSALNLQNNSGNLSLTGYSFTGWATQADGGGVSYLVSQLETPTANMNLYAKWTIDTYTVTYNGNANTSGVVPGNQTKTYNVSLTLSGNSGSPVLAKTGHTFGGWNTASGGGGTSYAAGAAYTTNAAATLYAQWTPDTYTVTYNGNGSTGGSVPADQTKTYDASLTLQTNSGTLTKGTDTFSGWNSAADGSGTNYAAGASYTANAGTTLYAKWTAASSGGSGRGPDQNNSNAGSKKTAAVMLITVATTAVKGKATVTQPSNANNSNATGSGSTGSTGSGDNSTPAATSPSGPLNVNTVKLSETTDLSSVVSTGVDFSGKNLDKVTVKNNEVSVQAKRDFSGKTEVTITTTNADNEVTEITATVIVLPLQVTRQSIRAISGGSTRVTWVRSPNAIEYEISYNGEVLCRTSATLCFLTVAVPPNETVQIKSIGKDNTESLPVEAKYNAPVSLDPTPEPPQGPPAPQAPATTPDAPIAPAEVPAPIARVEGVGIVPITVTENADKTGLDIKGADWAIAIDSTKKLVQGNTEDSSSRVVIEKGNTVTTNGSGFKPNTQVDVWVYSTPIWLGAVMTDENGNFVTTLPMPDALSEGEHTFQAKGQTPDGLIRSASVPITLIPAVANDGGRLRFEVYFGMNSVVITSTQKARINAQVKRALSIAAKDAKFSIKVVGWVQPNPNPGNIAYLSKFRANNAAAEMKKLGLKGKYALNYAGLGKDNEPKMRHASVVIVWNKSQVIDPSA